MSIFFDNDPACARRSRMREGREEAGGPFDDTEGNELGGDCGGDSIGSSILSFTRAVKWPRPFSHVPYSNRTASRKELRAIPPALPLLLLP